MILRERNLLKCDHCGGTLLRLTIKHTNIQNEPQVHYFCTRNCKTAWIIKHRRRK